MAGITRFQSAVFVNIVSLNFDMSLITILVYRSGSLKRLLTLHIVGFKILYEYVFLIVLCDTQFQKRPMSWVLSNIIHYLLMQNASRLRLIRHNIFLWSSYKIQCCNMRRKYLETRILSPLTCAERGRIIDNCACSALAVRDRWEMHKFIECCLDAGTGFKGAKRREKKVLPLKDPGVFLWLQVTLAMWCTPDHYTSIFFLGGGCECVALCRNASNDLYHDFIVGNDPSLMFYA